MVLLILLGPAAISTVITALIAAITSTAPAIIVAGLIPLAALRANNHMSCLVHSLAPGFCALNLLDSRMNNPSFVWVHRLQGGVASSLNSPIRHLSSQGLKGFLALLTVISYVQGQTEIRAVSMICYK